VTAAKNDGEPRSPGEETDHYHLLQIDPDAPHDLIIEAYWYVAGKLRAEQATRKGVQKELDSVNVAYTELVNPERRHAYDATVPRVQELRRARAEAKAAEQSPPLLTRLLRRLSAQRPRLAANYYAILAVDPQAEAPLIARAHAILHALRSGSDSAGRGAVGSLAELDEAYSALLDSERRAAYDRSLSPTAEPAETSAEEVATTEGEPAAAASPLSSASTPVEPPVAEPQPAAEPQSPQTARRHLTLRPVGRGALIAGRSLGRCAVFAASSFLRGIGWAVAQGGRRSLALAQAVRRLAERWGERRGRERSAPPADLLDRRIRRDAVPPQPRREKDERKEAPGRAHLLITEASGRTESVILGDKPITLGSDRTCEVVLEGEADLVAAAHAQIWFAGDHFVIRSLSPRHATRIGEDEINWAVLDDRDEIEVGRCRIRFEAMHPSGSVPDLLSAKHSPH
jgi:curved DNA-binding protein CbpA